MRHRSRQRGMTFWTLSFFLGVLAFSIFVLFKLIPPYMESFKVGGALDSLARQPDVGSMSKAQINEALYKRFDIDNVDTVKLDKDLTIESRGRLKIIRVKYENVVPLLGNVSFLIEFDHAIEVRSGGSE